MRQSKTHPSRLAAAERRAYVYRLKEAGASYIQIEQTIKNDPNWAGRLPKSYTQRRAHEDVMYELQRYRAELATLVEDERTKQMNRLERLLLAVWQRAIGTATVPADLQAVDRALAILDRIARIVPGMQAPTAIAPVTPDGKQSYQPDTSYMTDQFVNEVAKLMAQYGQLLNEQEQEPIDVEYTNGAVNGHPGLLPEALPS